MSINHRPSTINSGTSDSPETPHEEFEPASQSELGRFVRENREGLRRPLYPVGGRTSLHYGWPLTQPGVLVSTSKLARTVDYPARDMTITVEAGVRFDELAGLLREERQQLPIDVAQSNRATLGGVIATNTSGPRRFGYGTLRDYVIGVSAVDAQGRAFKAGGRVVKNVAGYDLCKLFVGSLGTLAILTQVTLKLRPIPESTAMLWAAFPDFEAIDRALQRLGSSAARPVIVDVLTPAAARQIAAESRLDLATANPVLLLGVEGSGRETDWQVQTLKDELAEAAGLDVVRAEDAQRLLQALTEFPVGSEEPLTFRASLPPSRAIELLEQSRRAGVTACAHAGNGIVTGHLPDDVTAARRARDVLAPLAELARRARGSLVVVNCDDAWKSELPVFGDPPPAWDLMQRLKRQLDPLGLLNPGRLFGAE